MISKIIKNIITVLVIIGCLFAVLLGITYRWHVTEELDYRLRHQIAIGEVREVEVIPIGKMYDGKTSEKGNFYEVYITYQNTGNYPVDYLSIDLQILETGSGYEDHLADAHYLLGYPHGMMRCVPAGKEGILKYVIELRDDFESVKMIYTDGYTKEEQVIDLEIRER